MNKQNSLFLVMQEAEDNLLNHHQQFQGFCDRQKSKIQSQTSFLSSTQKSSSKVMRSISKNTPNQQLQDLLENQTINYCNTSNLTTQKKRLFTELSFFSKDCTHDHSNEQGYTQFMNKVHFQRLRNRQLNQQLTELKEKMIQKYLKDLMQQFKELSQQNSQLRQIYKKQMGGGCKPNIKKNQSMKIEDLPKNVQTLYQNQNQTPRNVKTGRRSIAAGSMTGTEYVMRNNNKQNPMKQKQFFGIGNANFFPSKKLDLTKQSNKMQYCESSININGGQSLVPSPKRHKRRQSQLTERKDYPTKQNGQNDYLLIFDNNSEVEFDNLTTGRMSQPGKMSKQRYPRQIDQYQRQEHDKYLTRMPKNNNQTLLTESMQRNSQREYKVSNQQSNLIQAESTKNIFIQFLQQLLLQQRITYSQVTEDINDQIQQQTKFNFPSTSYQNIKHIQQLEKQIMTKNLKLKQLQEVINVFKSQIQQVVGTDLKIINQLMIELLEVKGKYLQMQEKVNGITGLKKQIQAKQKMKQEILQKIKQKMEKKDKQNALKSLQNIENFEIFSIPQSIKTLFELLNINMKKNAKPIDYLNEVKQLPKNKQLFHGISSKKRTNANVKIKQIIDSIRQGRKKFNEVIKIYEGRITKLQQKLQKYKNLQKQEKQKQSSNRIKRQAQNINCMRK